MRMIVQKFHGNYQTTWTPALGSESINYIPVFCYGNYRTTWLPGLRHEIYRNQVAYTMKFSGLLVITVAVELQKRDCSQPGHLH